MKLAGRGWCIIDAHPGEGSGKLPPREEFVCGLGAGPRQAKQTPRQIQIDFIVFGSGQHGGAVVSAVAGGVSTNSSFSVWLLVQPGPLLSLQKPCDPQCTRGRNRKWMDGRYILKKKPSQRPKHTLKINPAAQPKWKAGCKSIAMEVGRWPRWGGRRCRLHVGWSVQSLLILKGEFGILGDSLTAVIPVVMWVLSINCKSEVSQINLKLKASWNMVGSVDTPTGERSRVCVVRASFYILVAV